MTTSPNSRTPASPTKDLIYACVMECYFREHMAERDLLFHETLAAQLNDSNPDADANADDATLTQYLEGLQNRLQTTDLPKKLKTVHEKSPDLLGVILNDKKASRMILQNLYHNSRNEERT